MKNFFKVFILLTCMGITASNAQSNYSIFAHIGPTFPTGDFDAGMENEDGGLAEMGGMIGVGLSYDLRPNYNISVEFQSRFNKIDEDEILRYAETSYPGIDWKIDAGKYNMNGIMAGLGMYLPAQDKFSFGMRLGLGVFHFSTPELSVSASAMGENVFVDQNSDKAWSGAFDLEAEFIYKIDKKNSISLNPDYFVASPKFDYTDQTTGSTSSYEQNISTLGLSICYNYRF